jgi:hypothetical protein
MGNWKLYKRPSPLQNSMPNCFRNHFAESCNLCFSLEVGVHASQPYETVCIIIGLFIFILRFHKANWMIAEFELNNKHLPIYSFYGSMAIWNLQLLQHA